MHFTSITFLVLMATASTLAYDSMLTFKSNPRIENRTLDEIYQAALQEGGTVTIWHGGDEKNQQDALKNAFEARFTSMTLNLSVDLSKYHDASIDQQLATQSLYVDSAILQTLHDYPRWKEEGALLNYAPLSFEQVWPGFKDQDAAWYGTVVYEWGTVWNEEKAAKLGIEEVKDFQDFLRPELKGKIVLTYPNDDDAVLYAFNIAMQQMGTSWFSSLLAQSPHFVRGTATPATLIAQPNNSYIATFTSMSGLTPSPPLNISFPTDAPFVSWPQTAAIFKDAPHPEGAKLLHSFLLSEEWQQGTGTWSVRRDVEPPAGFPGVMEMQGTDVEGFGRWMADRERVERLRFWFEGQLGTAQGVSPLVDDV